MGNPYRKIGRGYRAIIKVRVTPAQKEALEAEAERRGCYLADLVRDFADLILAARGEGESR